MKPGFRKVYFTALLAVMSPSLLYGQHHPVQGLHDGASHDHYDMEGEDIIHGGAKTRFMSLKRFEQNLPQEADKILPYLMGLLNGEENRMAPLFELAESKAAEPELSLRIQGQEFVHQVQVNTDLLKNPIYLLEVLIMLDHYMNQGPYTSDSKLDSYTQYHTTIHPHTHEWIVDPKKHVTVHYHSHIFHSLTATLGIQLASQTESSEPYGGMQDMELRANAKLGSVYSQLHLLKRRQQDIDSLSDNYRSFRFIKDLSESEKRNYLLQMAEVNGVNLNTNLSSDEMAAGLFRAKKDKFRSQLTALEKRAREKYTFERKVLDDESRRLEKDQLEKMTSKLNDLLLRNDREGVASLIESYLPFETMEPVEKQMWNEWVDAIRNPDKSNSYILYRGLDRVNDKLQMSETSGGQKNIGLFSVLLNKNQGSFTRRLRSLTTMRYKIMSNNGYSEDKALLTPLQSVPLMTRMMLTHSGDPKGSPFMSFTTNPAVAHRFAESGIIAISIDKRRVLPNIVSSFTNELEMLIPLLVFPDEVVTLREVGPSERLSANKDVYKEFLKDVETAIQRDHLQTYPEKDYTVIKNAFDLFDKASATTGKALCRQIFK